MAEKSEMELKNELLESVLRDVGGLGRFQKTLIVLSYVSCFLCAANHLGPVFTAFKPKFACLADDDEQQQGNATLSEADYDSSCATSNGKTCASHSFDTSVMRDTVVTDYDLVCDRLPLLPVIGSSYMAGIMIASVIAGYLADRLGRRTVMLVLCVLHVVATFTTFLSKFVSSFPLFLVARFFVGGSVHLVWSLTWVILMEVTVERRRGLTGGIVQIGWNIGAMLMTFSAFALRSWHWMQLANAVFSLLLVLYYILVPESPRWFLEKGRSEEAREVFLKIAKTNGVEVGGDFDKNFAQLKELAKDDLQQEPLFESFKNMIAVPEFTRRALLLLLPWFAMGMSAYGVHFSVKFIPFDIFVLAVVKEASIIVCTVFLILIWNRFDRTVLLFGLYLVSGALGLAIFATPDEFVATNVVLYIACQGLMVAGFFLIGTYTPEAFSTDTRSFMFAALDGTSKLGTTLAPFVVDLGGEVHSGLPIAVFGGLMIVAAVAFLFAPETRGRPMAQNIRDLESRDSIQHWTRD